VGHPDRIHAQDEDLMTEDTRTEDTRTQDLRRAERRLQAAQLASDVPALEKLLDDRLIFTGPDGNHYTKGDDLHAHRSGQQSMTRVSEEDLTVLVDGGTGVTWFLGTVEGALAGAPFTARVRYTRTWIHDEDHDWRVVAAHVSPA
jgi:ketosteroid isomerase-like protein